MLLCTMSFYPEIEMVIAQLIHPLNMRSLVMERSLLTTALLPIATTLQIVPVRILGRCLSHKLHLAQPMCGYSLHSIELKL